METYIKKYKEIIITDVPAVGGKNASLGEMYSKLSPKGIRVPDGFATTSFAFEEFLRENSLVLPLRNLLAELDKKNYSNLKTIGAGARTLLMNAELSHDLAS